MADYGKLLMLSKLLGLSGSGGGGSAGTYVKNIDDEAAYLKELPHVAKDGSVVAVGGKTVAMNQLVQNGDFCASDVADWYRTQWSMNNGSINILTGGGVHIIHDVEGTSYAQYNIKNGYTFNVTANNKYLFHAEFTVYDNSRINIVYTGTASDGIMSNNTQWAIWEPTSNHAVNCQFRVVPLSTSSEIMASCDIYSIYCIDLTQMFGAGNEPTLDECRKIFTADYYPYNTGSLVSAAVDKIITRKADGTVIAEYPIPAAVQALEGYGWSAGTVYNSIEYDATTQKWWFKKRVGALDLGDITYSKTSVFYSRYARTGRGIKNNAQGICAEYPVIDSTQPSLSVPLYIMTRTDDYLYMMYSNESTYGNMTVDQFKAAMSGVLLYYEMDTPTETDITSLMGDYGEIKLAPNGFIEFHNSTNPALQLAVPNTVTYWQKVADEPDAGDALQLLTGMRGSNDAVNRNALNTLLGGDNV